MYRYPTYARTPDASDVYLAYERLRGLHAEAREANRVLAAREERLTDALAAARRESAALAEQNAALRAPPPERAVPEPDERYVRLAADFDNVRRHQAEAVARAREDGRCEVLADLIATADLLRAAADANPDRQSDWYVGHVGILRSIEAAMARHGVRTVGAVGERFDPTVHEAVARVDSPGEPDLIAAVQRPGYASEGGRLIRPAQVAVTCPPAAAPERS